MGAALARNEPNLARQITLQKKQLIEGVRCIQVMQKLVSSSLSDKLLRKQSAWSDVYTLRTERLALEILSCSLRRQGKQNEDVWTWGKRCAH